MSAVKRFHLLHTNDLHSRLEQTPKIHTLASHLRQEWERRSEAGFFLDIGDHMDRVRLETEGTDGKVNRAILEASGYDLITLGNNELLTFSQKHLEDNYLGAPFSVVSSNVVDAASGVRPSWIKPRQILTRHGVRFAFLGVTIPYEMVYELMGWKVQDPFQVLAREVAQLRDKADVIVILSHLGYPNDCQLAELVPGIDLIIGGHTHHLLETPERIGSTWIAGAGKFGSHLGRITIEVEEGTRQIARLEGCCYSVDETEGKNEIQQIIDSYRLMAEKNLSRSIIRLERPLPVDWKRESPFGNLLADSLRDWVGTEIALVNSGQLLNGLPAGTVSRKQLHQVCPHPINPVLLQIKGREIRRSLEESLLEKYVELQIRGFGFRGKILGSLCVSGLNISADLNAEPYQKIRSIRVGHSLLYDEKEYHIATIDMFTFGSGYLELKRGKLLKYFLPEFLRDVLAYRLQKPEAVRECEVRRWQVR